MKYLNGYILLLLGFTCGLMLFLFVPPPKSANAALSESSCASLVVSNIQAQNPLADSARLTPYWTAICKGILDHIKSAGQVQVTITGGSSAGIAQGTIQ